MAGFGGCAVGFAFGAERDDMCGKACTGFGSFFGADFGFGGGGFSGGLGGVGFGVGGGCGC